MLYNRAPELRELFIKTLNCVTNGYMTHTPLKMIQSLNFRDRVNPLKRVGGSEEGGFQKSLLLTIVRLINADPMLMLHNQVRTKEQIIDCFRPNTASAID